MTCDAYILWTWNKYFIKNRYLHCNTVNIQYALPKGVVWSIHFPNAFYFVEKKGGETTDSSTQHDLQSIEKHEYVKIYKTLTE